MKSQRLPLLLSRHDVASLITLDECIEAVEQAFRMHGEGKLSPPGVLGAHVDGGGFHLKTALLNGTRQYFAAKLNSNFPQNLARFGLPTIQGLILLFEAESGCPLAVMDSTEITIQRTGAATAIAAKYLARAESSVVTICGCGNQGRIQLQALSRVLPIRRVFAHDKEPERVKTFIAEAPLGASVAVEDAHDPADVTRNSDVIVTCTPSERFYLRRNHVRSGTFIAAVGADNAHKQELEPALFAGATVVADIMEQCAAMGDLHHALEEGVVDLSCVHAELGELAAGLKRGRTSPQEITIFDSTGTALQDVAAAALVYEKAIASGAGTQFDFAA